MNTKENTEQRNKIFDVVTLRDYFAAKAMQGIVNAMYSSDDFHGWTIPEITNESYIIADSMMEARK